MVNRVYRVREMALEILSAVESGEFVINLIGKNIKELDNKNLGLLYDLVFGILRNRIYIDKIIEKYSSIPLKKIDKTIINSLRIGIYQFIVRGEPNYVSVDSAVSIVKGRANKSFVNAIMRRAISTREYNEILPDNEKRPIEYLSIKYSQKILFIKELINYFGSQVSESILECFNKVPNTFFRINKKITNYEEVMNRLLKKNIKLKPLFGLEDFLYSEENISGIFETDSFRSGLITVMDVSQGIGPLIAGRIGGGVIGDLCSGLGGKLFYLSELLSNKSIIVSVEISVKKIKLLKENIKRLGDRDILVICSDLRNIKDGIFDIAILDVPCSNSGNFGRHPEARYRLKKSRLNKMIEYQRELFRYAIKSVKKGGILIYTTCSLLPSECHLLIKSEVEKSRNIEIMDIRTEDRFNDILNVGNFKVNNYGIYIMPYSFRDVISSGGFISVVRKVKYQ
ncbi:MAG: transcription antitermination factor NusB [bacterium]